MFQKFHLLKTRNIWNKPEQITNKKFHLLSITITAIYRQNIRVEQMEQKKMHSLKKGV